jgi:hypothetical protein
VEEAIQTAKGEAGLEQYEVRRYDAWYRHVRSSETATPRPGPTLHAGLAAPVQTPGDPLGVPRRHPLRAAPAGLLPDLLALPGTLILI